MDNIITRIGDRCEQAIAHVDGIADHIQSELSAMVNVHSTHRVTVSDAFRPGTYKTPWMQWECKCSSREWIMLRWRSWKTGSRSLNVIALHRM
jgi:hypothetical protein